MLLKCCQCHNPGEKLIHYFSYKSSLSFDYTLYFWLTCLLTRLRLSGHYYLCHLRWPQKSTHWERSAQKHAKTNFPLLTSKRGLKKEEGKIGLSLIKKPGKNKLVEKFLNPNLTPTASTFSVLKPNKAKVWGRGKLEKE